MHLLLPYFIIFLLVLQLCLRRNSKNTPEADKAFWERERKSNSVRRQDIEHLDYIVIPDTLPAIDSSNPDIKKQQKRLNELRDKKILNLTGYSNTDLKMKYGAANFSQLSEYDENYTILVRTLAELGRLFLKEGFVTEAVEILEYGIQCRTDITANYTMLAQYYHDNGMCHKIDELIADAGELNTLSKNVILEKLEAIQKELPD